MNITNDPRLSTAFVKQQQCDMEDQQQTWCESVPSFQGKLLVVSGWWECSNEVQHVIQIMGYLTQRNFCELCHS